MLGGRGDDPRELAVLDPGGVEQLDVADPVGEDDPLAVPVEPVVDERLVGLLALGPGQGRAVQDQAVHEAVADGRELDEPAAPEGLVAERLGVEAGGQLAAVAQPHADALGHGHARASEDAAEDRAQVGLVPAVVGPGVFVLVAPVPVLPAVEAGERRQERRARSAACRNTRLPWHRSRRPGRG